MSSEVKVLYHIPNPENSFSATLRIMGDIDDFGEISKQIGVSATHIHRKVERRGPRSPEYKNDLWSYTPKVDEAEPSNRHLEALSRDISGSIPFLVKLKRTHRVDIFCSYRSNCSIDGLEIGCEHLKLFLDLAIPLGVSVIFEDRL